MRACLRFVIRHSSFVILALAFASCQAYKSHVTPATQAKVAATGKVLVDSVYAIAERTVYNKALSAEDVVAKNFNVAGFADGLRELESGVSSAAIAQIPAFVMQLRAVWLPGQTHYTDLAAQLGAKIEAEYARQRPATDEQRAAIIEAVIKGLQTTPKVLNGP